MSSDQSGQTAATLSHHLQALGARDLDAVLEDYAPDSIIFSPWGISRGLAEARTFFTGVLEIFTPQILSSLNVLRQDIDGEVAYLVWTAGDTIPMGSDTFVVRDGKIRVQTVAAYMPQSA
jgi:ketosteroid isomerase-like protein